MACKRFVGSSPIASTLRYNVYYRDQITSSHSVSKSLPNSKKECSVHKGKVVYVPADITTGCRHPLRDQSQGLAEHVWSIFMNILVR